MSTVPACRQAEDGPGGTVWFVEVDGECPAEEFLKSLDVRAGAQFKARFERIAAIGALRTPEMGHYVNVAGKPKIFEIKVEHGPGYRLYAVRMGTDWYATHGCKKPKDKQVPQEAKAAREIFEAGGGHV